MATSFPGSVDNFPRPGEFNNTDDANLELDVVLDHHSDAIEAVETRVLASGTIFLAPPIVSTTPYLRDPLGGAGLRSDGAYGTALPVPAGYPVPRIRFTVEVAEVGKVVRVIVYGSKANGLPGTVLSTSDIPLDTTGEKLITGPFTSPGSLLWVFFYAPVATSAGLSGMSNNARTYWSMIRDGNNCPAVIYGSTFSANPSLNASQHDWGVNPWWVYDYLP